MINSTVTVTAPEGLHLRPAGILSKLVRNYNSETTIKFEGKDINAKKMMAIMSAGIKADSQIEIVVEGEDETVAMAEIQAFFDNGMQ
ncbi:MAG: HPr family phosphocarrier protein [Bacillota bacterium]